MAGYRSGIEAFNAPRVTAAFLESEVLEISGKLAGCWEFSRSPRAGVGPVSGRPPRHQSTSDIRFWRCADMSPLVTSTWLRRRGSFTPFDVYSNAINAAEDGDENIGIGEWTLLVLLLLLHYLYFYSSKYRKSSKNIFINNTLSIL